MCNRMFRSKRLVKSVGLSWCDPLRALLPAAARDASDMNSRNALHPNRNQPVKRAWIMRAANESVSRNPSVDRKAVENEYRVGLYIGPILPQTRAGRLAHTNGQGLSACSNHSVTHPSPSSDVSWPATDPALIEAT